MSTIHVADKHENIKLYGAHNVVHIYYKQSFTLFSLVPYVSMVIRG